MFIAATITTGKSWYNPHVHQRTNEEAVLPHTQKHHSVLFVRKWGHLATCDNAHERWGHYANWNARQRKTSARCPCWYVGSRKAVGGWAEASREPSNSALKAHTSRMRHKSARNATHSIRTTVSTATWYTGKSLRGWILRVLTTRNFFSSLLSLFLYLILTRDYEWMVTKLIGVIFSWYMSVKSLGSIP